MRFCASGVLIFTGAKQTIRRYSQYLQGYSPSPGVREYFYFIDHQGQVNFKTCFNGSVSCKCLCIVIP